MKVDLGNLDPSAFPSARGAFYVRNTKWGPRAQAWPKPGRHGKTSLQQQFRTRFGFAAKMAATPYPVEYDTAAFLSQGTEQVPRDLLTQAALGRFYEIVWPDGTVWDNLTGPLVYTRPERADSVWEWAQWDAAWNTTFDTGAFACKGNYFRPSFNDPIYSVRVIFNAVAGAIYKVSHGWANAANVIQQITHSGPQLPNGGGMQLMQFDFNSTLRATEKNFLLLTRTDGATNYALPININQGMHWLFTLQNLGTVRIATNAPVVGQTLLIVSAFNASPMGFRISQ